MIQRLSLLKALRCLLAVPYLSLAATTFYSDNLSNNPLTFESSEKFVAPGEPTTDFRGARSYARLNNSMVFYMKTRLICGSGVYGSRFVVQNPVFQQRLANLKIPFVAGWIAVHMSRYRNGGDHVGETYPDFMDLVLLGDYFELDGPFDDVLECPNDELQHAILPEIPIRTSWHNGSHVLQGDCRTRMEKDLGVDLGDICSVINLRLYSRDDTGVPRKRTDFDPYLMENYHGEGRDVEVNNLKSTAFRYLTWPRVIDMSKNDPSYVHGLIDTTGKSSGENYLLHIAVGGIKNRKIVSGPYNETNSVRVVVYYDNIMDWYRLENVSTNKNYTITSSDVIDKGNNGVVYVFANEDDVLWSTNAASASERAMSSCRLNDATSGFAFSGVATNMWVCFALSGSEEIEYKFTTEKDVDRTAKNQLVRYAFTLSETDSAPQEYNFSTNQIVFAKASDLIHEGDKIEVSVTRNKPDSGKLDIHVVREGIQTGLMTWGDGEYGAKTVEWDEAVDEDYNSDTNIVIKYQNYFMNIRRNVVLRDRLVKYSLYERKFYEQDGIRTYPENGDWFVDYDDILRAKRLVSDTNICSMVIQSDSPRRVSLMSSNPDTTCYVFDSCRTSSVLMTGFEYVDSEDRYVRREALEPIKQPIGDPSLVAKCHTNVVIEVSPLNVIRIQTTDGAKIETFEVDHN